MVRTTLILMLFLSAGCDFGQPPSVTEKLSGVWINMANDQDKLTINDTLIVRTATDSSIIKHHYTFSFQSDKIELTYVGQFYILAPPQTFDFVFLDQNTMEIKGFSNYFPKHPGDVFQRLSFYESQNGVH